MRSVAKGILSPLLCSLVVDKPITGLNENGCHIMGFTEDIAILLSGKVLNTVLELLQGAEYGTAVVRLRLFGPVRAKHGV